MEGLCLDTVVEPDKVVSTHCCFCGQQCGINLKVKDNIVIGFEPHRQHQAAYAVRFHSDFLGG
ncbi:MAG: hypothetical protein M3P29_09065 [Acidobacteriota bacterium]|nr:hypothetical protein [Acidobacteriota bacterium]